MNKIYNRVLMIYVIIVLAVVILLSSRCTKIEEVILPYYDTTFVVITDSNRILISDTIRTYINDTNFIIIYIYDTIQTVTIGSQQWMDKDLHTLYYNNGDPIKIAVNDADWSLNEAACCYYLNDDKNGILYNWYAVNTGKLCPDGFHVPSEYDWNVLADFLGDPNIAGGKLKEKGYDHWYPPNLYATDEYGFKAIPAWFRYYNGQFAKTTDSFTSQSTIYWSSSIDSESGLPVYRQLQYNTGNFIRYRHGMTMGFTLRCLKDN